MSHDECDHKNCTATPTAQSVCQTVSEMDWERGIWNAALHGDNHKILSFINKSKDPNKAVNLPDKSGYTALHYAARYGHDETCKLLLQNGAKIDAVTHGKATPIHKAVVGGHADTVKMLLQHGASPSLQDIDGQTALHKAVQNKSYDIANLLIQSNPLIKDITDSKGNIAEIVDMVHNP